MTEPMKDELQSDAKEGPVQLLQTWTCSGDVSIVYIIVRWGLTMLNKAPGTFNPETNIDFLSLRDIKKLASPESDDGKHVDTNPELLALAKSIRPSDIEPQVRQARFRKGVLAEGKDATAEDRVLYRDLQRWIGTSLCSTLPPETMICVINYSEDGAAVVAPPDLIATCASCGSSYLPFTSQLENCSRVEGVVLPKAMCAGCKSTASVLSIRERELKRGTGGKTVAGRTAQWLQAVRRPPPTGSRSLSKPDREGHLSALAVVNAVNTVLGDTIQILDDATNKPKARFRVRKATLLFTDVSEERPFTLQYASQFDTLEPAVFEHIPMFVAQFGNHKDGGPWHWQVSTSLEHTHRITSCADVPESWRKLCAFLNNALGSASTLSVVTAIRNTSQEAMRLYDYMSNPLFIPPGVALLARVPVEAHPLEGHPPVPVVSGAAVENWKSTVLNVNIDSHVRYIRDMRNSAAAQLQTSISALMGRDDDEDVNMTDTGRQKKKRRCA